MGKFQRFDGKTTDTPSIATTHPSHKRCRVDDCSDIVSGSDGLCCYHRALQEGAEHMAKWRVCRRDWREPVFADFDERHKDDAWGAALRVAADIGSASNEDARDFLGYLKTQARRAVRRVPHD